MGSQKSRGLQWSHRRVVDQHSFLGFNTVQNIEQRSRRCPCGTPIWDVRSGQQLLHYCHSILPPLPSPYRLDASLSRLRCLSWSSNGNFLIALLACMLLKETHTSAFFKPAHLKYVGTMLLIPAIALDGRNIFGKQYICF